MNSARLVRVQSVEELFEGRHKVTVQCRGVESQPSALVHFIVGNHEVPPKEGELVEMIISPVGVTRFAPRILSEDDETIRDALAWCVDDPDLDGIYEPEHDLRKRARDLLTKLLAR